MRKNSNVFNIDSKTYRSNLFLEFINPKIEASFTEDYASRQNYSLICFQIFGILQCVYYYFAKGCFSSESSHCSYKPLLIGTLLFYFGTLYLLTSQKPRQRCSPIIPRALLVFSSIYFHVSALERFESFLGWGLIFLQIYVANMVCFSQWKRHLLFIACSISLLLLLLWQFDKMLFREAKDNFFYVLLAALVLTLYASGQEKVNKENWVIMDSFRKSERFLEKFIDESNISIIVVDQGRNIMLCNFYAREFLRNLTGDRYRKIFQGNLIVNFQEPVAEQIDSSIEKCLENNEDVITCMQLFPDYEPLGENDEEEVKQNSVSQKRPDEGEGRKISVPYELNFAQVDWKGKKAILLTISKQTHKMRKNQLQCKLTEFSSEILNQLFHRLTKQKQVFSLTKPKHKKKQVVTDLELANSAAHYLSFLFLLSKETQDLFENSVQNMCVNFSLHDCLFNVWELISAFARERNTELLMDFPTEIENYFVFEDMTKLEIIFLFISKFLVDKSADATLTLRCINKPRPSEESLHLGFEISCTNVERNLSEVELRSCFNSFTQLMTNPSLSEAQFTQRVQKLTFNEISLFMANLFISRLQGEIKIDHESNFLKLGFELKLNKGSAADKENTISFPELETHQRQVEAKGLSYIWSRTLEVVSDDEEEDSIEEATPKNKQRKNENAVIERGNGISEALKGSGKEAGPPENLGLLKSSIDKLVEKNGALEAKKRDKLSFNSNVIDINFPKMGGSNEPAHNPEEDSEMVNLSTAASTNRTMLREIAANAFEQVLQERNEERLMAGESGNEGSKGEGKDFYVAQELKKHFFYLEEGFIRTVENLLSDILRKKDENQNAVFYFPSKVNASPIKTNRIPANDYKINYSARPASPRMRETLLKRNITSELTERAKILEEDPEKFGKRGDGDDELSVNFGGANAESPNNKKEEDKDSGDLLEQTEKQDKLDVESGSKPEFTNNAKKEWELKEVELLKNQMKMKKSPRKPYEKEENGTLKVQKEFSLLDARDSSRLNDKSGWDIFRGVEECEKSKIVEVLDMQVQESDSFHNQANNQNENILNSNSSSMKLAEKEQKAGNENLLSEIEDPEERLIARQALLQRQKQMKLDQLKPTKSQSISKAKGAYESKTAGASPNIEIHKQRTLSDFKKEDHNDEDCKMVSRPFRRPSSSRQLSDHVLSYSSSETFTENKRAELNKKLSSLVFDKKPSNSMKMLPHPHWFETDDQARTHRKNILLIDEDPKSYKFLGELQSEHADMIESVVWAPSEETAVEEINKVMNRRDFEIIIADISKASGLKAIERIFHLKKDITSVVFAFKGTDAHQEHDNEFYKQYHIEYILCKPLIMEELTQVLAMNEPQGSIIEGKNVMLITGNAGITVNFHFWSKMFKFSLSIALNEKEIEANINERVKIFLVIIDMPEKRANELLATIIKCVQRQSEKPMLLILKPVKGLNEIKRSESHKPSLAKQNILTIEKPLTYHLLESSIKEYQRLKSDPNSSQLLSSPMDSSAMRDSLFNSQKLIKSIKEDSSSSNDKQSSSHFLSDSKASPSGLQPKLLDLTEKSPSIEKPKGPSIEKPKGPAAMQSYYPDIMILAVDDNNWILLNLSRLQISVKFKMESALKADDAFDKYLKAVSSGKVYHLLLIDVKMPKKDGLELTRQIRAYEKENNIKKSYICGMKTDDDNPDDQEYLNSGMDDVCMKPIKNEIFDKIVTDSLKRISQEEQASKSQMIEAQPQKLNTSEAADKDSQISKLQTKLCDEIKCWPLTIITFSLCP